MTVDIKELKKKLKDASAQVGSGWSSVSKGGTECPFSGIKVKNDRNENAAAEIKVCFDQMIQAMKRTICPEKVTARHLTRLVTCCSRILTTQRAARWRRLQNWAFAS
jgi:hypothetical protein